MCVCWQVCHVEDAAFSQALDSFAPGYADVKSLARACLAFRDFPPMGTEQNLREALGSVAVNYVLIERDERGCGTGLCYAQVSRPSVAFRSAAENRSVPLGIARRRFSPPPFFFVLVWFGFCFCVFHLKSHFFLRLSCIGTTRSTTVSKCNAPATECNRRSNRVVPLGND